LSANVILIGGIMGGVEHS